MANKIWVSVTGDFTAAASWNPAGAPANGDILNFTGDSQQNVTTNLSNGALNVDVNVHEEYVGLIASSGSKLILGTMTFLRFRSRGGKAFITPTALTRCTVEAAGMIADAFELAGTTTTLYVIGCGGSLALAATAAVTTVIVDDSPSCTLTIPTGVTGLNLIEMSAGRVLNGAALSTGTGPRLLCTGGRYERSGSGAHTTIEVSDGGLVVDKGSGAITTLRGRRGGTIDGRQNRNTAIAVTDAYAHPGGRLILRNGMQSYDVTNAWSLGGVLEIERGEAHAI